MLQNEFQIHTFAEIHICIKMKCHLISGLQHTWYDSDMTVSEWFSLNWEWPQSFAVIHPSTLEKQWKYNPALVLSGCKHHGWETSMWHDCHLLCLQRHRPLQVMETRDVLSVTRSSSSFRLGTCDTFGPYSRLLCWTYFEPTTPHCYFSLLSVSLTADVLCMRNHSKKFTLC